MRDLARTPSQLSTNVAKSLSKEIQRGFDQGTDPYGRAWRELSPVTIAMGRFPPPLTDTRAGRNSVVVSPNPGAGVRIMVGAKYMIYHQFGSPATRLPRRSFIPFQVIPRAWGEIVLAEYEEATRKALASA